MPAEAAIDQLPPELLRAPAEPQAPWPIPDKAILTWETREGMLFPVIDGRYHVLPGQQQPKRPEDAAGALEALVKLVEASPTGIGASMPRAGTTRRRGQHIGASIVGYVEDFGQFGLGGDWLPYPRVPGLRRSFREHADAYVVYALLARAALHTAQRAAAWHAPLQDDWQVIQLWAKWRDEGRGTPSSPRGELRPMGWLYAGMDWHGEELLTADQRAVILGAVAEIVGWWCTIVRVQELVVCDGVTLVLESDAGLWGTIGTQLKAAVCREIAPRCVKCNGVLRNARDFGRKPPAETDPAYRYYRERIPRKRPPHCRDLDCQAYGAAIRRKRSGDARRHGG